jgi:hypothetical protein
MVFALHADLVLQFSGGAKAALSAKKSPDL